VRKGRRRCKLWRSSRPRRVNSHKDRSLIHNKATARPGMRALLKLCIAAHAGPSGRSIRRRGKYTHRAWGSGCTCTRQTVIMTAQADWAGVTLCGALPPQRKAEIRALPELLRHYDKHDRPGRTAAPALEPHPQGSGLPHTDQWPQINATFCRADAHHGRMRRTPWVKWFVMCVISPHRRGTPQQSTAGLGARELLMAKVLI